MTGSPAHVGVIPDGLRRWARANGATLTDAYLRGSEKVTEILLALRRNEVQTVSVYNLSRANLARPGDQLEAVYAASTYFLNSLIPANFDAATCGFRMHGDRDLLPADFVEAAEHLESTMTGSAFHLNLLAAYDAEDELRSAYRRAQAEECDINDAFDIGRVDMVIRTTPEPLLSGFLPYQSQYAQLRFLDTPLNDLDASRIDARAAAHRLMPQLHGR